VFAHCGDLAGLCLKILCCKTAPEATIFEGSVRFSGTFKQAWNYGWEVLACSLHRDLRTSSRCCVGLLAKHVHGVIPCLCLLPKEPSPEGLQLGTLRLCRGDWHSKIWQKIYWCIVLHTSIFGRLFEGLSPHATTG